MSEIKSEIPSYPPSFLEIMHIIYNKNDKPIYQSNTILINFDHFNACIKMIAIN